jgi:hypothetical protein
VVDRIFAALKAVVARYPALVSSGLAIGVAFASRFGLHLTETQLVSVISAVVAFLGILLHAQVSTGKHADP